MALYLNTSLGYSESTATQIYHAFILCCYFTPVIGAWISDGYLGKFRTIFYISIVYAIGQVVLTVGSMGFSDASKAALSFLGLATIAFGTGGIKVRFFSINSSVMHTKNVLPILTFSLVWYRLVSLKPIILFQSTMII